MREVTKIVPFMPPMIRRKRVAAYARVSCNKEAMLNSMSAQISHYSGYIQQRIDWEYVGVYADEGITGTKEERPEFQRLMNDCRNGLVDMVITKAVTRFARNTLTTLTAIRELTALGINVYFENERINSISGDGELMLSILASYAQEESRSVSENCKWRIRKRFQKGEIVSLSFIYGYKINEGEITVDPEQAEIVRMIYADYIGGMGSAAIVKKLRDMRVPTLFGGKWDTHRILDILKNEKYTGNALLQKFFVADHLSKKKTRNVGQLPQYYAEGTHPAIIGMDTYNAAKAVIAERAQHFNARDTGGKRYPFTGKIRCSGCGMNYRRKTTNGKVAWQCATFIHEGKAACHAKAIPESTLFDTTAGVLGLDVFDADVFNEKIVKILVPGFNRLVYVFHNGLPVETTWQDRSRRDSWTDEMKQAARERQLDIIAKGAAKI